MVNLLMRFYEVNGGSISIDGIPTKDMQRKEVRDVFGMVLQDTWVLQELCVKIWSTTLLTLLTNKFSRPFTMLTWSIMSEPCQED